MNELITFTSEQFGAVRTIAINNEPWFVGKDVAEVLGYQNTPKAIRDHVDSEDKLTERIVLSGQNREVIFINESGLYSLILSSKLPNAKEFKRWVTSEILPAIRKTGGYIAGEADMDEDELIAKALIMVNRKLEERTAQLTEANTRIAKLEPKAAYYDQVAAAKGLTTFRDTAKLFGVKEKDFTKFIEDHKLCYRNSNKRLIAYAEPRKNKWFELKEYTCQNSCGETITTIYTKITPLGRQKIFEMMRREALV